MSEKRLPPRYLIAIVGSRGSLKPLFTIIRGLRPDLDAAIVVLFHRGAKTESHLAEILSRATLLPARRRSTANASRGAGSTSSLPATGTLSFSRR